MIPFCKLSTIASLGDCILTSFHRIENERLFKIRSITNKFSPKICCALSHTRVTLGYDVTVWKYNNGKVYAMKKLSKNRQQCAQIQYIDRNESNANRSAQRELCGDAW